MQNQQFSIKGIVYLIHLSSKIAHSQHYFGWTSQVITRRLEQHRKGQGARFLQVACERGARLLLVRVWAGSRHTERRFKNMKNARRYCPLCHDDPRRVCQPRFIKQERENHETI